ncbi:MAG: hypothetical protein NVSMB23_16800 [Myxococcales bacterium]
MTTASATPGAAAEALVSAALARNDAYLRSFVEALGLCPYARACREGGRLQRRVLLSRGGQPGSPGFAQAVADAAAAVRELERLPAGQVEVALLLFPALDSALARGAEAARSFEALCAALREALGSAHGGGTGSAAPEAVPPFYCVAFHPDLPEDLADAHRAVGFVRRSPDPTLQLVRRSVLQEVRGNQGSIFVAARELSSERLEALSGARSVSDRIAEANLETLRRAGPDSVRALLAALRADG